MKVSPKGGARKSGLGEKMEGLFNIELEDSGEASR